MYKALSLNCASHKSFSLPRSNFHSFFSRPVLFEEQLDSSKLIILQIAYNQFKLRQAFSRISQCCSRSV